MTYNWFLFYWFHTLYNNIKLKWMTNRKQVRQVSNSKTEKMIKKSFSVYDMTLIVISLLSYLLDIISGKKTVHQDKRKLKLSFVHCLFLYFFIS